MSNPLSPFFANLFMTKFETKLKQEFQYFPRIWLRYENDVFTIFNTNRSNIHNLNHCLIMTFPSIKFTCEIENRKQLPFLDVLVIKNGTNNLEFDLLRKDTHTQRYIPKNSLHARQQKMASINFLGHPLLSFSLKSERFDKEKSSIKEIAVCNLSR